MTPKEKSPSKSSGRTRPSGHGQLLWLALGWVCVVIGAVGLILPLLPGVPFLIVALWAFSKSSERFHTWLYTHEIYGPPLRAWDQHGVISPPAKFAAALGMAVALAVLIASGASPIVLAIATTILAGSAVYVISRPNRPPNS